jgi:hypothetical protein
MSRTARIITTSGLNLYAKPAPIASGTWGDDIVALTANANDGREYTATVGDGDYVVFVRAGASPADTDLLRWTFDAVAQVDLVDSLNATAVTQIATAVWAVATSTLTTAGTIGKLVTDTLTNLASMIEDSTGWRFTAKALEQGKSVITPIASTVDAGEVSEGVATYYLNEGKAATIAVVDSAGSSIDLTGKTLTLKVEDGNQVEQFTVSGGSITPTDGSVDVAISESDTDQVGTYCYYLREPSNGNRLWAQGVLYIRYAG